MISSNSAEPISKAEIKRTGRLWRTENDPGHVHDELQATHNGTEMYGLNGKHQVDGIADLA
jgi:hypothetical protein